uniref:Putative lipoate-protein ligase A n=1 Tax=Cryptococcus bacillisporus CA1280 TaxID=1296109 RepID=A0A0D0VUG0_CRYGA|nr:lipoate-protein ligase A [Cryptococcus bacillisporus CA1280]
MVSLSTVLRSSSCLPHITRRALHASTLRSHDKAAQPQTPATENIELGAPITYISKSHDPWFNLSYEDWLFRSTPHDQPVLFLYRNFPCVVIGRNQNPWKETTPKKLREESIPLVRRRSGGGTVYHDMGNTNFSIILPRLLFTRSHGAQLVSRAVRETLGITGTPMLTSLAYVSGSAYKIIQHRAYHHGTMLISSSLAELGKSLRSSSPKMETKGIASYRSPVTTLNHYLPPGRSKHLHHDDFVRAVTAEFTKTYAGEEKSMTTCEVTESMVKEQKIWDGYEELKSWEWQYGQTPEFTNELEGNFSFGDLSISIAARHALITSMGIHLTPPLHVSTDERSIKQAYLDSLALSLVGKRYESLEGFEGVMGEEWDDEHWRDLGNDIVSWLRKHM